MTLRDAWCVIGLSTGVVVAANLLLAGLASLLARIPQRPPPPDVILPEGWQCWFPDGRGYLRLYQWRSGRWCELPKRRINAKEEPSET